MTSVHNNYCDGGHCKAETGEVRCVPIGGESNANLCRSCFDSEITWRKERNAMKPPPAYPFEFPAWETLEIVNPEG